MMDKMPTWIDVIKWGADGLAPVAVQDYKTGILLMHAWMSRDSLLLSLKEQRTVFWSRSRACLWRKGETSGHVQYIKGVHLDCDADTLLVKVEQKGGIACHTGRQSCFYRQLIDGAWQPDIIDTVDGG